MKTNYLVDPLLLAYIKREVVKNKDFGDREIEDQLFILDLIEWAISAHNYNYLYREGGNNVTKH